ncbi:matrix Gla protein [Ornithorhynchus anatinus]|uniref:Matrix Gla protein n=1 Tax=Ornithorhynchus anatinus TaxID=9258 RepID=A0A6I8P6A9_ORNAN|nr:matrix Gla protein [Ornithorhynchus anatinus]XP_028913666.1 matrix Gla protein [Ornithorhynchus anatinus]
MKTLLLLSLLVVLAAAAVGGYESHESMESYEMNPFIPRRNANSFIAPRQRWRSRAQERARELSKPSHEIQREACDDYPLCQRYARNYGYRAAYTRYPGGFRV